MAFFKRPTRVDFSGLAAVLGRQPHVLAHGIGDGDVVLAITREELALRREGQWQVWRWELVAGGSWNGESGTFTWRTMDGERFEAALTEENRVPEAFRERVLASTLVQSVVDARPRGQVQVVGRRSLSADPQTHWYAVPSGGADLNDPVTREAVVAETDRLRTEYF
ncbi:hypothetical protein H5392_12880 [Tessaracoccus sp. MC1865]|uniref:hypothetical protein n=1 Tax=Tessaracoccus sp. MC1865 TaxID=2760310 RepID=UPI0015FF6BCD|nr:hypothetical protein [Tessaracoccus sp. MC1865]MBB1484749.1 hypothetical protein [Tessaracoccus sp. MC1865]QTO36312.1 hypothetical protein J7D54_07170 [Tessaracoccus sp. MC1865]